MQYSNLCFTEAVEELARSVGMAANTIVLIQHVQERRGPPNSGGHT